MSPCATRTAPVGPGRSAVILQEGRWNYANVGRLALDLSGRFGFTILTHELNLEATPLTRAFRHTGPSELNEAELVGRPA
ncbi:MAG: hypothetical protein JWN00_1506 [Actinomycetia bacterium]|nr:hypothetical protein [Actinomycetes bacterium]